MTPKLLVDSISTFSPLLPLVAGVKKRPGIAWYYVLTALIFNLLAGKVFRGTDTSKMLANIYVIVEFFLVSFFFYRKFNRKQRWVIYIGFVLLFLCLTQMSNRDLSSFNFLNATAFSLFYISYCVTALYGTMVDVKVVDVFASSFFLVTIGMLIYFSGMFFLLCSGGYFQRLETLWGLPKYALTGSVWSINSYLNIVQSVIFARAFWIEKSAKSA